MKSRVHPTYKTKYHVSNGAEYDRSLVRRGDITLWLVQPASWLEVRVCVSRKAPSGGALPCRS